jgi:carbon-monoxide dehydrogenase large subunit
LKPLDRDKGRFRVAGTPSLAKSWESGRDRGGGSGVGFEGGAHGQPSFPAFPFGCRVAVVEVDTETGYVRLRRPRVAASRDGTGA